MVKRPSKYERRNETADCAEATHDADSSCRFGRREQSRDHLKYAPVADASGAAHDENKSEESDELVGLRGA
jgi:hypothetical protein